MEEKIAIAQGVECADKDINLVATEASSADDWLLAELLRLPVYLGSVSKGVLPFASSPFSSGIISGGASDATVHVFPFRGIIGPRSAPSGAGGTKAAYRDIRTVVVADDTPQSTLYHAKVLDPTISNNRWDLVYCKVTLDAAGQTSPRFVRGSDGSSTLQNITETTKDTWTIAVVKGTEAATPTRPTLPSDSGSDYYIPLAYVGLTHPFTSASQVTASMIHEVAPCIPINRSTGAASLRVANGQYNVGGFVDTAQPFLVTGKPKPYMPPTMFGKEELLIACSWNGTPVPAASSTVVVDNSCDWRKRVFKWTAWATSNALGYAWIDPGGPTPGHVQSEQEGQGQSFFDDGTAAFSLAGGVVGHIQAGDMATPIVLFVDLSDGSLKVHVGTTPASSLLIWLEASGQFANAG